MVIYCIDGEADFSVLIALFCIPVPYLHQAICFQHSSSRARQLSQHLYDKAMVDFTEHCFHILYSTKDCRNDSEARMLTSLKQAAEINNCDVMISFIASDKHHLAIVKQNKTLLNLVLTTATLDNYAADTLNHIISCMMVLHDMKSGDVLNSQEEEDPTEGFVHQSPISPLMIAWVLYIEASKKLKQIDQLFDFSGSRSVNIRAMQLEDILARENEM